MSDSFEFVMVFIKVASVKDPRNSSFLLRLHLAMS